MAIIKGIFGLLGIALIIVLLMSPAFWEFVIGCFVIFCLCAFVHGLFSKEVEPEDYRTNRQRTHDAYHAAKLNAALYTETQSEYDERKRLQRLVRDSY